MKIAYKYSMLLSAAVLVVMMWNAPARAQAAVWDSYTSKIISSPFIPIDGSDWVINPNTFVTPLSQYMGSPATDFDNGVCFDVPLPFTFVFNGIAYTSVNVAVNGWINFGQVPLDTRDPQTLFNSNLPNGTIAPFFGDHYLRPDASQGYTPSRVSWSVIGSSGARVFTVQWENLNVNYLTAADPTQSIATFQVQLKEDTATGSGRGPIEFNYGSIGSGMVQTAGATVGIEDESGLTFMNGLFTTDVDPDNVRHCLNTTLNWPPSGQSGNAILFNPVTAPFRLVYSTNPATYTVGVVIAANTPSNFGGTPTSYSISGTLPAGLSFSTATGVITGTPIAVSPATSYTITASNTGGSTSASLTIIINGATYCTPPASTYPCWYFWLVNVSTTGGQTNFSNNSGCSPASYTNYSGSIGASQYQGQPINVSITGGGGQPRWYSVWVDWNDDGVFDASEHVIAFNDLNNDGNFYAFTHTMSFVVPLSAPPGTHRMRVREQDTKTDPSPPGTNADACAQVIYGETEDYAFTVLALSPCSGPPTPGNTLCTATAVCSDMSFTLSLQNSMAGIAVTYQWQSSPTGAVFTDISGATAPALTTSQSATTYYHCVVICTGSGLTAVSSDVQVMTNPPSLCYCIPPASTYPCSYMWITNVATSGGLTNFNNSTGCSSTSYSNYGNSFGASQYQASPVTLSFSSQGYALGYGVWIDFNDDGVFQSTEHVISVGTGNLYGVTATFTVPASARVGTHRMRVRGEYSYDPADPCSQLYYGETEDYAFTVVAQPPCSSSPAPGNTVSNASGVCNSSTRITLSLQNGIYSSGVTYQWQSSSDNVAFTDIADATTTSLDTYESVSTWYHCVVTCTNSGLAGISNPLPVTFDAPVLTCSNTITVNSDAGQCGAFVTYPAATATGRPAPSITYSQNSGTLFPVGTTTVTVTASNSCGAASCSFAVIVRDLQPPVITGCPSNILVNPNAGQAGAIVNYSVPVASDNCSLVSQTFAFTGAPQLFTVPPGVTQISVDVQGAQGGAGYNSTGGLGGRVQATIAVTPGQILNVNVGGAGIAYSYSYTSAGGWNGGGGGYAYYSGTGGGASDIRQGGSALSNRVLVAGGGGGGGYACGNGDNGGAGGGLTGATGWACGTQGYYNYPGTGGTQSAGGTSSYCSGGTLGAGGDACYYDGGSGGGGYYGGGSAGYYGGGGGGSNFATAGATGVVHTQGFRNGSGLVVVSYVTNLRAVQTSGLPPGSTFPAGTTHNTFTATDPSGNTSKCTFTVTVIDNQPPIITVSQPRQCLWPPNHKYVAFTIAQLVASATDNVDGSMLSNVMISKVTSDEVDNSEGTGSGNTVHDIVIGSGCRSVNLRSERNGTGNGRIYTITLTAKDAAGNVGTATCIVCVPHDQSGSIAVDDGVKWTATGACAGLAKDEAVDLRDAGRAGLVPNPDDNPIHLSIAPNPFRNTADVLFDVPVEDADQLVELKIFDMAGRDVTTLVNEARGEGHYTSSFNANALHSGQYVAAVHTATHMQSKMMIVIK